MYTGGRFVKDKDISSILPTMFASDTDSTICSTSLDTYRKWINNSKLNKIIGLDNFLHCDYTNGTSEVFDHFRLKHKDKKFKFYKGEYRYHRFSGLNYQLISNCNNLMRGDALIISLPFSSTCDIHKYEETMITCEKLDIPVLVDCALFGTCSDIIFNFTYTCIEQITFSLSKTFPISQLRVGIRFSRIYEPDGISANNRANYINRVGALVGNSLMENFSSDYIYNKYKEKQKQVCRELGLKPTNCVTFALGDNEWSFLQRDGLYNRACLSERLIED